MSTNKLLERIVIRQWFPKRKRLFLEIVLAEGRNRQIRGMCRETKLLIYRLVRVAIGNLRLAGLKPGQWRELSDQEAERL